MFEEGQPWEDSRRLQTPTTVSPAGCEVKLMLRTSDLLEDTKELSANDF